MVTTRSMTAAARRAALASRIAEAQAKLQGLQDQIQKKERKLDGQNQELEDMEQELVEKTKRLVQLDYDARKGLQIGEFRCRVEEEQQEAAESEIDQIIKDLTLLIPIFEELGWVLDRRDYLM
ncbi:hypothetical protein EDC01DRAFT_630749 [Geopyxis carbonaria]|nr:hypothetical protein EDC01DRAFT_630749 [Geopyxis carbonaria]